MLKEKIMFENGKIGSMTLKNRVIRAGCFEGMAFGGSPSDELIAYHMELAKGGVAMTTVAYCSVSEDGRAYGQELWMRREIVPQLRRLTDAVHREGAACSIQLGHCGFFSDGAISGKRPIGPSVKFCMFRTTFSRKMSLADIERVRLDFVNAALLAREAGFDAVEIHAGHGYLLSQFLSPWTNRRSDEWGGKIEDRLKFPRLVIRSVKDAMGSNFPIIVKMNVEDGFKGGLAMEEAAVAAKEFEGSGADALVPSCGFTAKTPLYMLRGNVPVAEFIKNRKDLLSKAGLFLFGKLLVKEYPFKELFLLEQARKIRQQVKIPVILIGGVTSKEGMEGAIGAGFEFVQLGRALVMDPDFVVRLKKGLTVKSECDHCNRCVASMDAGSLRCVTKDEKIKSRRAEC